MVGNQLLVSTSLINSFGTSVIDQHVRELINVIGFLLLISLSRVSVLNCVLLN